MDSERFCLAREVWFVWFVGVGRLGMETGEWGGGRYGFFFV